MKTDKIPMPPEPGSLTEYAAWDAAKGVADSWTDALKADPSFPVEAMVSDLSETIELLKAWKDSILASEKRP